jgi:mono/diheme cytochrome c family protein
VYRDWNAIVTGGVRAGQGMRSFAAVMSEADAQDIRAYVLAQKH